MNLLIAWIIIVALVWVAAENNRDAQHWERQFNRLKEVHIRAMEDRDCDDY